MHYLKILFLIFFCQFLNAQELAVLQKATDFDAYFPLEKLSVSDGLFENNIQDVLQDSYGFLWLAGMAGLQKYDGYTFKYYKPDSVNPAWQEAERLFEDSKKTLWVQMNEGLVRYDRESDNFVRYYFVNDQNDTIPYKVTAMAEDRDSVVWFWVHGKGLFTVDYSTNHFIADKKINTMYDYDLNNLVRCMAFDLENNLWIGTNSNGLIVVNSRKDIQKKYDANPAITGSLSNNTVTSALCDLKGDLWFATNRGLNLYNPEKDIFTGFFIDRVNPQNEMNMIQRIADDGQGNIWTVTNTLSVWGIGRFNKNNRQFQYSSVPDGWPNSLAIDRSGILWFGNRYQGLYKLDRSAHKFFIFTIKKNGTDLLKDRTIQGICKDNVGDIWFGANPDGLYRFNPSTGDYNFYRLNRSLADIHNSNFILEIYQDSMDRLWIGTKSGLILFNRQTGHFKLINPASSVYAGTGRTATIVEDAQGKLWLITVNGMLIHFDPKSEKMEFYSLPDKNISFRSLVLNQAGLLWIGSLNNGLFRFDIAERRFAAVKEVRDKYISALSLEEDSILWCATNANGLIRYNTETKTKKIITQANGLLSNGLLGIEQDKYGNLWLSSHRGLMRYNPQDNTFKNYFREDGFLTNEFHYRGHFQDKDGQMIFGSSHGLVVFHPDNIKDSDFIPPVLFTDIKTNNKLLKPGKGSVLKKHISVSEEIILTYEQNDLSITFSALDFSHPLRNKYAFYLENMEETWRPSGKEHTAYYTNLDPGEYIFRVKGTNSDGVWNEQGASLRIIILPPWWKTTWAYILYVGFTLGLLYGLRRYELSRQNLKHNLQMERVEAEKYQEINQLKSRFFANISHEFRTPLTLIKGPVQQMLSGEFKGNIKKQYQMILRNSNRLLKLINQLLDLSRLDAGQMILSVAEQDIIPLLKGLTQSFESLARQKNIELHFQSSVSQIEVYIDQDKFEKIIVNLLSNAFKFTPEGGAISVEIKHPPDSPLIRGDVGISPLEKGDKGGCVSISITNSGSVIPSGQLDKIFYRFYQTDDSLQRGKEGTGIGLALTKELVELHHGIISVTSNHEKGTTFLVKLPMDDKHLRPEEIISETKQETYQDFDVFTDIIIDTDNTSEKKIPTVGNHPKLLIVEDNPDMRSYMVSCLESDYKINQAENGEKGFQQAIKQSPDIIISDVMMPGMDGFQFCSRIKSNPNTSHIPVILLTAKASADSKIEGLETGADDYLIKPFDKKELRARIKNLVQQRQKLQQKFRNGLQVKPRDVVVTSLDEKFLQQAIEVVEKHMPDTAFDTQVLASEMAVSRRLLYAKLKALTGLSTGEFIRNLRLKRAAQLLRQDHGNVSQIAYDVGFLSLSYFAKVFRELFGQSPSQYISQHKN